MWEPFRAVVKGEAEAVKLRGADVRQLSKRPRSASSLDKALKAFEESLEVLGEYFGALEEAVVRRGEKHYVVVNEGKVRPWKERNVVYVPRVLLLELVDSMKNADFWLGLLAGDGVVHLAKDKLGLAAGEKYLDAAGLFMQMLALRYGVKAEPKREKGAMMLDAEASKAVVSSLFEELKSLFEELRRGGRLAELASVVNWWYSIGMPGGSDPPKLISLMALYEKAGGGIEYLIKRASEMWMEYNDALFKKAVEEAPHVSAVADKVYVLDVRKGERRAEVLFRYPAQVGGKVIWAEYRLWTDWRKYYLYCERGLPNAEELAKAIDKNAKREKGGNRYYLDATAGRALYYLLTRRAVHTIALGGKAGERPWADKARIELLEVKENGDVKFRIWYYEWFKTRPHQPYVDVEIKYDEREQGFRGRLYANEAEGISRGDLRELHDLFTREKLPVTLKRRGGEIMGLQFTGGFRNALLSRVGYRPKATAAEPASVKYLGGLRFEVEGRVVEFEKTESKKVPLYAVLQFGDADEAVQLYRRLKAAGVYAEVVGREVRLDDESYWGLLITSGAVPEGYKQLYPPPSDKYKDLYVFKRVEGGAVYYYFAVKHSGVWRAVGGKYDEKGQYVMLQHAEREVLEALREAVKKVVKAVDDDAELGKIGEYGGVYRVVATRPVLAAFEERALKEEAQTTAPPEVYLRGGSIIVKHGGEEHEVEFALVKGSGGVFVDSSLYPALQRLGVRAEVKPQGVKLYRDGVWGLLATAVESALKRGEEPKLPQGVALLKARPEWGHYAFSVEAEDGRYIYSVLKFKGQWTAMGGKVTKDGKVVLTHSEEEVAKAHAEAFNKLPCVAEGRCRRKEAKLAPDGYSWYFRLYRPDLRELGL